MCKLKSDKIRNLGESRHLKNAFVNADRPVETKENAIVCKPLDKLSPKKPKDLMEIENEGTIYRLKEFLTQEQISKG